MNPPVWKIARLKAPAFTLIETVLALGIVAITLVPMMGLLPVGLNTHRNTIDRTTSVHITQQIAGEIMMSTSALPSQQERYFDDLGQETYAADNRDTLYFANIVATPAAKLPGDNTTDRTLTCVTVEVCYNPSRAPLTRGEDHRVIKTQNLQVREYTFNVSL